MPLPRESSRPISCPLCGSACRPYFSDRWRDYLECENCELVHVAAQQWPSNEEERAHYGLHDNRVDDPGYRHFLGRLATPLRQRLPANSAGLDFGCGPGPALAAMLEEAGHQVSLYDIFFHPHPAALEQQYDFITATEVLEHLQRPGEELERLWQCLKPGGWLGIMTRRLPEREKFEHWHYRRDPTHIVFFADGTFEWLARHWNAGLVLLGEDVALLTKQS